MAKDFVRVRILELPSVEGGCACNPIPKGFEYMQAVRKKYGELKDALAAQYPGQADLEVVDLTDSPEEKETEAGRLLVTGKYPSPLVVIDGEPRFAGSIHVVKIVKEVGKLLTT